MRQTPGLELYRKARSYEFTGFSHLVHMHADNERLDWDHARADATALIKFLVLAALNPEDVYILTPRLYALLKLFGQMFPEDRDAFCSLFVPAGRRLEVDQVLARVSNRSLQEILDQTKQAFLQQFDKPFAWPEWCEGVTALYSCSPISVEVAIPA